MEIRGRPHPRAQKGQNPVSIRLVPMHKDLYKLMKEWYEENHRRDGVPIVHWKGKAIGSIQTAWEGIIERAGIRRRIRP